MKLHIAYIFVTIYGYYRHNLQSFTYPQQMRDINAVTSVSTLRFMREVVLGGYV